MFFVARSALTIGSVWNLLWVHPLGVSSTIQNETSSQLSKDGLSLGALNASRLPHRFGPPSCQSCGPTNLFDMPDSGVTREYEFNVSYQDVAPDGVTKRGIVVNGQYPGPIIEANWGDWIQITVHNVLGADNGEGTSMHWHGFLQKESQWMDGVPGVQQCPIAPGKNFTYRFRADQYGTSWYHSHYSAQYSAGASGPIVIYGPDCHHYDIDLGPVMVSDWYHHSYEHSVKQTMEADLTGDKRPPQPACDNNLINGFGVLDSFIDNPSFSNASLAKFRFTSGKKHRLRLINSGAAAMQRFSIDDHNMTVIAYDFVPVRHFETTALTLGVGQRADVVIEATGNPSDAFWMRSDIGLQDCNFFDSSKPQALAIVLYENADPTARPASTAHPDAQLTECKNDDISTGLPLQLILPDANPSVTTELHIENKWNGSHHLWYFGGGSYRGNFKDVLLRQVNQGITKFAPQSNVHDFGSNKSVRFVIYNHVPSPHPMHHHGHNFWVLADGIGKWNGTIINPNNPQRRDVHILRPAQGSTPSYMVIQIELDNPGIWPFHCHSAWHNSAGLYLNILERPKNIRYRDIPDSIDETCRSWDAYTSNTAVGQIDSGV